MKLQRAWMLPLGLLAVVRMAGCGEKGEGPKTSPSVSERPQPNIGRYVRE